MGRFHDFIRDTNGGTATVVTLVIPVVLGSMALATEASLLYLSSRKLQTSADMAAYSAGLEIAAGRTDLIAATVDDSVADAGLPASAQVIYPFNGDSDLVSVSLTHQPPRLLSALFSDEPMSMQRTAVSRAINVGSGPACLLALDPQPPGGRGISITGNASASISGCGLHSNALGDEGVFVDSNSAISMGCVASSGGVVVGSNQDLMMIDPACPQPRDHLAQVVDPLSDMPEPLRPLDLRSVPNSQSGTITLSPGLYSSGMDMSGDIILEPGLYYVDQSFRVNANANISVDQSLSDFSIPTGQGVVFYFSGSLSFAMNGNATLDLAAPDTGPYEDVIMFFDRLVQPTQDYQINGNFGGGLTGAIYAPSAGITLSGASAINGSGSATAPCMQVVARTVSLQGNTDLNIDCSDGRGNDQLEMPQVVRLVQ